MLLTKKMHQMLVDQLRDEVRSRHYSIRTEKNPILIGFDVSYSITTNDIPKT